METIKSNKLTLSLKEVLQDIYTKEYNSLSTVKSYFIYQWYPENNPMVKIIINNRIPFGEIDINENHLLKIIDVEKKFLELDELGIELQAALTEFQTLIKEHKEKFSIMDNF